MAQSSALRREVHEAEEQLALMLGIGEQVGAARLCRLLLANAAQPCRGIRASQRFEQCANF